MNRPQAHTCPLPPEPCSYLPFHPKAPGCHTAPALGALHHTSNSHWLSISHFFKHIAFILSLTKSRKTKWEPLNIKQNLTYVESKMEKTPQVRVNALSMSTVSKHTALMTNSSLFCSFKIKPESQPKQSTQLPHLTEKGKSLSTEASTVRLWHLFTVLTFKIFWVSFHLFVHSLVNSWT